MDDRKIGVSVRGVGTKEEPCLAVSEPVTLRYEVVDGGEPGDDAEPMLSFHHGNHRLGMWSFSRAFYESGRFDRAFSEQVVVALEGSEMEDGTVGGSLYAFTYLEPDPEWLFLGLDMRKAESRRSPDDPCLELGDLLASRLND